jgi:hypothetical protein
MGKPKESREGKEEEKEREGGGVGRVGAVAIENNWGLKGCVVLVRLLSVFE